MNTPKEICIFTKFAPYLRIINAFDANNFGHRDWRQNRCSVCYAFGAAAMIVMPPVLITLSIWLFFEHNSDTNACIAALPEMISVQYIYLAFIAMLINKRNLVQTIQRIQIAINQRKLFVLCCFSYMQIKTKRWTSLLLQAARIQ